MSGGPERPAGAGTRSHYSYAHYADAQVAEGFHELRFGGPIGRYLLETQERLLVEALTPERGTRILDVGAGTGRAAIGLATAGASVIGVDASVDMLRVAARRTAEAGKHVEYGVADAHQLPIADRSVDGAISLRVLMHTINWPVCVAELCRVARWRVVVDFPALGSFAALESGARRVVHALGGKTETYRVMSERAVAAEFARHGFRVVIVRRQFVLPIAVHKKVGRLGFTRLVESGLASIGMLRLLGSPVTMVAER